MVESFGCAYFYVRFSTPQQAAGANVGNQLRRRLSFRMISRRLSAYSSMIRLASSTREGVAFSEVVSSGRFIAGSSRPQLRRTLI